MRYRVQLTEYSSDEIKDEEGDFVYYLKEDVVDILNDIESRLNTQTEDIKEEVTNIMEEMFHKLSGDLY